MIYFMLLSVIIKITLNILHDGKPEKVYLRFNFMVQKPKCFCLSRDSSVCLLPKPMERTA